MDPVQKQVAIYKKILANPVWQKTPLLKMFHDRMWAVLKRLLAVEGREQWDSVHVCVLLYHQQGGDLRIWQDVLQKIRYAVNSRPIFLSEGEASRAIRDPMRESYVVLEVPKIAVTQEECQYHLKGSSIVPSMIKAFFWRGKTFYFNGLSLVESETAV